MVILQSLDALNVVSVGIRVGMYNFTCGHIEVSQNKVIASRIEIVLQVIYCIDSLLVVVKRAQSEFFLSIHHFDHTVLLSYGHHSCVWTHA